MDLYFGIIVFILGLLVGSFLNVCVWRIPRKESIVFPASHCPRCNERLGPWELVPVLSWAALRGRCRHCGARISGRYPAVELLTALLFIGIYARFGLSWLTLPMLALTAVLIAVSFIDLDHAIIPNGLVLFGLVPGALVTALVLLLFKGSWWDGRGAWWDGLAGLAAGASPLLLIDFLSRLILKREGMGGGDVKLMAMVGLFLGWRLTLLSLLLAVYLGGLAGIILLLTRVLKRGGQFPFGPFLAAGSLLALFFGNPILHWWLGI